MQTLAERLKFARQKANLSQQQIAELAGMSQPTYYKVESGKTLRTTYLNELANVLKVSPTWLATGKGEMTHTTNAPQKAYFAPVMSWAGQMGDAYLPHTYESGSVYWLIVQGDGMAPEFRQGDYLLIDTKKKPKAGSFVIATLADDTEATFRRYKPCGFDETGQEYWQLVPVNNFYPVIDSRHKPFDVVGVVVEHRRRIG